MQIVPVDTSQVAVAAVYPQVKRIVPVQRCLMAVGLVEPSRYMTVQVRTSQVVAEADRLEESLVEARRP